LRSRLSRLLNPGTLVSSAKSASPVLVLSLAIPHKDLLNACTYVPGFNSGLIVAERHKDFAAMRGAYICYLCGCWHDSSSKTNSRHLCWYRVCRPSLLSQTDDAFQSLAKALPLRAHTMIRSPHTFQLLSGHHHRVNMEHPNHHHTSSNARPAASQRSGSPQSQEEEEHQTGDHIGAMIDDALAMLEGQQGVGVFCVCKSTCECKEVCAIAARHTKCACACYDALWPGFERVQPIRAGKQR
jgi:hypothetical protein